MTTASEAHRGHIADLMCALRPDWHVPGCVAALRKLDPSIPLPAVIIAAVRYAEDHENITPAHLSDIGNRTWDSDWYPPCKLHPEQTRRHTSGECASCRSDRRADETGPPPRPGTPPPAPLREMAAAHTKREHVEADTAQRQAERDRMEQARAELDALRQPDERSHREEPQEAP